MDIRLKAAVGLLLLSLIMITLRRLFHGRALTERANAYCSHKGDETREQGEPRTTENPLAGVLTQLGLGAVLNDDFFRPAMVASPIALALGWSIAGWIVGISLAGGAIAVIAIIARWRNQVRTRHFADQLPVFLERVRRLVLIGNTLPHAFIRAVESSDPAVKHFVYPVVRRLHYGTPFQDSIEMLSRQNNIAELHMLTAYVKTNVKFGGRVGQTLLNLINQLANKRRLEREIYAATSETRASAAILFGLMAFVIVSMSIMNPSHLGFYLGSNRGRLIIAGILAWPLIGALVMKRILKLDF